MSGNIGENRNLFLKLKSKLGLCHVVLTRHKTSPEKITLTFVEMQQLPEIEKVDSKNEIFCLNWTIYNGRRKVCISFKTDIDKLNIVVYRYRKNTYVKDTEMELKLTEYEKLLSKRVYLLSYIDVFLSGALYWMKQLFIMKVNLIKIGCSFLMSIFRKYTGVKMSFEHKNVRKNFFLSACFCWKSGLFSHEMDQKIKFGGTIGYGDSYLHSVFRYSKVNRLHAISRDAAGAVRLQTGQGPGYCYMIGRGPNCCLLGHVTGLLFCLYVKIFPPSIFNLIDF